MLEEGQCENACCGCCQFCHACLTGNEIPVAGTSAGGGVPSAPSAMRPVRVVLNDGADAQDTSSGVIGALLGWAAGHVLAPTPAPPASVMPAVAVATPVYYPDAENLPAPSAPPLEPAGDGMAWKHADDAQLRDAIAASLVNG